MRLSLFILGVYYSCRNWGWNLMDEVIIVYFRCVLQLQKLGVGLNRWSFQYTNINKSLLSFNQHTQEPNWSILFNLHREFDDEFVLTRLPGHKCQHLTPRVSVARSIASCCDLHIEACIYIQVCNQWREERSGQVFGSKHYCEFAMAKQWDHESCLLYGIAGCSLFRGCSCIEVNERTVGTLIVCYIMGVCC